MVVIVSAVILFGAVPSFAASVVAKRDARIYSQKGKVLGTVPSGAEVELLLVKGHWYQLRYVPPEGAAIEGWSWKVYYEESPTYVEALRDTPILGETRREIGKISEGECAELLEVRDVHLLVRYTLDDGSTIEGFVRKNDVMKASAADFARQAKEALEGSVKVGRAAGLERRRTKTFAFGKQTAVVEIIDREETVWLQIVLASNVPLTDLKISYQFYAQVSDAIGQEKIVEGKRGVLAVQGSVGERPLMFKTEFVKYEWQDQIVDPNKPEVAKANLPDHQIGERYYGYRVGVFWHGVLLKTFEENAPAAEDT